MFREMFLPCFELALEVGNFGYELLAPGLRDLQMLARKEVFQLFGYEERIVKGKCARVLVLDRPRRHHRVVEGFSKELVDLPAQARGTVRDSERGPGTG